MLAEFLRKDKTLSKTPVISGSKAVAYIQWCFKFIEHIFSDFCGVNRIIPRMNVSEGSHLGVELKKRISRRCQLFQRMSLHN